MHNILQDVDSIISEIRMIRKRDDKGIPFIFWDLSTLTMKPYLYNRLCKLAVLEIADIDYNMFACPEARGFIFGSPLAVYTSKPFTLVRKAGKLPGETIRSSYANEYGSDILEMNDDDVTPESKVIIFDDILATGGTALAMAEMVENCGGKVAGFLFDIVFNDLPGYDKLTKKGYEVRSVIWSSEERNDVNIIEG